MMATRCGLDIVVHAAISEILRPQPRHSPDFGSTMHILLQGVSIVIADPAEYPIARDSVCNIIATIRNAISSQC